MPIFLLMFAAAIFSSNNVQATTFTAQSVQSVVKTTTGATASTVYAAKAANQAVYDVRAVKIAKASVTNAAKKRAFTPWGFALVAAFTAADYLLDPETESISKPDPTFEAGFYWNGGATWSNSSTLQGAIQLHMTVGWGQTYSYTINSNSGNQATVTYTVPSQPDRTVTFYQHTCTSGSTSYCPYSAPSQTPNDDAIYEVIQSLPPSEYNQLFENPITSKPNVEDMPEFQDVADDVSADYDAANDALPETVPTVDIPNGDTGTQEQTDTEPKEPDLCQKYPSILACLNTEDDIDTPEILESTINHTFSPVTLSSNSTCPELPSANTSRGSFDLDLAPICNLATSINPLIVGLFGISALYVLNGAYRRG